VAWVASESEMGLDGAERRLAIIGHVKQLRFESRFKGSYSGTVSGFKC